MKKPARSKKAASKKARTEWVIGRSFEKISAVEGIVLTGEMRTRANKFARDGVSFEERRRAIIRSYRKA
jgi:hypothetical protein